MARCVIAICLLAIGCGGPSVQPEEPPAVRWTSGQRLPLIPELVFWEDAANGRDLGGYIRAEFDLTPAGEEPDWGELAKFLLTHWEERSRAYAKAWIIVSVDAGVSFHFFVEPDDAGRWRIASARERWHAVLPESGPVTIPEAGPLTTMPDARGIERRVPTASLRRRLCMPAGASLFTLYDEAGRVIDPFGRFLEANVGMVCPSSCPIDGLRVEGTSARWGPLAIGEGLPAIEQRLGRRLELREDEESAAVAHATATIDDREASLQLRRSEDVWKLVGIVLLAAPDDHDDCWSRDLMVALVRRRAAHAKYVPSRHEPEVGEWEQDEPIYALEPTGSIVVLLRPGTRRVFVGRQDELD